MARSKIISQREAEDTRYITKVYWWMSLALFVTAIVAQWTAASPLLQQLIFGNPLLFMGIILLELFLVGWLAMAVMQMSLAQAITVFILYSVLNGLTLSFIFLIFTEASIALTFYVTAGTFALMSFYGYTTQQDLTSVGNLSFMGLIGIVLASFVNFFFRNPMIYWITTYIGILVFVGLIAYDTQKIKEMNIIGNEGTDEDKKEAIRGALTLYLDFLNLFLMLLRLFGQRRRSW